MERFEVKIYTATKSLVRTEVFVGVKAEKQAKFLRHTESLKGNKVKITKR